MGSFLEYRKVQKKRELPGREETEKFFEIYQVRLCEPVNWLKN